MSTASSPVPAFPGARSAFSTQPLWVAASLAAVLLGVLFAGNILHLAHVWNLDDNYSHGYLVLPISLALAYRIARRVGWPERGEIVWGLTAILFGLVCQFSFLVVRSPVVSYLGLFAIVRGLLVCAGGRAWASAFNFPLLFLFFMFPVPATWTSYAALWLQDVVSRVSETIISLFVVCHRVGHTIRLAGVDKSLVVAEECSGLGQIVSFLAFAALLGHLLSRPVWYRLVLLVAAVPVAIAANTLRVVLMNLGAVYFGTGWMQGALHDAPALFSVPVGIGLFLLFDWWLSRLADRQKESAPAVGTSQETAVPGPVPQTAPRPTAPARGLLVGSAVLLVAVAGQFAFAAHLREAGELSYPTLVAKFESLPLNINDPVTQQLSWQGIELTESRDTIIAKLPYTADDLLMRVYQNSSGAAAQLYMVHSRVGEDRKHHPEICIRDVSGAPEDLSFRKRIPLQTDGSGEAQRFKFQTGSGRISVVYYWHYTFKPTPLASQTIFQTLHQQVGVAAPSVTVQLSTGTDDPKTLEAIERQLLPALDAAARQQVMPPGTEAGCNRIPIALARS